MFVVVCCLLFYHFSRLGRTSSSKVHVLGCWLCTDQYTEATDSSISKKKKRREGRERKRERGGEGRGGDG